MARISGSLHVDAPPERVFDTVADTRNEPGYNPAMVHVDLLTPGPIATGTRFRALMGRDRAEMLVELTDVDRPHRVASRTTSRYVTTSGALTFAPEDGGTLLRWDWQVAPHGRLRLLGPLFGPLGARLERRIWTAMKHSVETAG